MRFLILTLLMVLYFHMKSLPRSYFDFRASKAGNNFQKEQSQTLASNSENQF